MNRIDRLTAMLIHLQSKKLVTAQELADRFSISLRTVYRDIRALEEGGVPIGAEAGRGYWIVEGYHLPPVFFSQEEAAALLIAGKLMPAFTDENIAGGFSDALFKIRSVLRGKEKEYIEQLDARTAAFSNRTMRGQLPKSWMQVVQQAIGASQVLEIQYTALYNNERTVRCVEPVGMVFNSNAWHMIAYCRMRKDYRDFRIDRIHHAQLKNELFTPHHNIDLEHYVNAYSTKNELYEIFVEFNNSLVPFVVNQRLWFGYTGEEKKEKTTRMHFLTCEVENFGHWLMMFGNKVAPEFPPPFENLMQQLADEVVAHYAKQNSEA